VALVQWAGSVIEVLAIYHETRGKGPVTQLMIGTTMLLDMCVLVCFAVGQNIVIAACPLEDSSPVSAVASIIGVMGSLALWVFIGIGLGLLLQAYLLIPPLGAVLNMVKPFLVVSTGGFAYYGLIKLNELIPVAAPEALSLLRVDPLLVCMIGAIWANHVSKERDGFREILHDMAPLVMPPFFTLAGATLDLQAILDNALAPPVLFSIRFGALALGSYVASMVSQQPDVVRKHLWMTLQSQSGVTLGLVAQMQMGLVGKQPWAKGAAATIIGCVVMNQLVGPTLCRFGIRQAGESQEEDDELHFRDFAQVEPVDPDSPEEHPTGLGSSNGKRHSVTKQNALTKISETSNRRPSTGSLLSTLGELGEVSVARQTKNRVSLVLPDVEAVITGNHGPSAYQEVKDDGEVWQDDTAMSQKQDSRGSREFRRANRQGRDDSRDLQLVM